MRKSVSRISIYTQLKIGIPWIYCIPRNPALSVSLPLPLGYNVREARQTVGFQRCEYWWNQSVCCILYQIFLSSLLFFVVVDIIGFLCKFFFSKQIRFLKSSIIPNTVNMDLITYVNIPQVNKSAEIISESLL